MIEWNFDADKVKEVNYEPLPTGDYRVRIEDVEEGDGQKWPYYKITLQVNGDNRKLWYYLSFMQGTNEKGTDLTSVTNTNLANLWNSFDIPVGELNPQKWIGKAGACRVKHDFYNGEPQAKVSYFIRRENQDRLQPWEDAGASTDIDTDFTLLKDDEMPF